jgi:MFS superfamily sulfate permease-like transporter
MNPKADFKIFKLEKSLYFSNCESFKKKLYRVYGFSPLEKAQNYKNKSNNELKNGNCTNKMDHDQNETTVLLDRDPDIILDFSAVNYIDTNGVKALHHIVEDYKKVDVFVCITNFQGK